MKTKQFVQYVFEFYGVGIGLYKETFGEGVTKEEIMNALKVRKANKKFKFVGDTADRELVRDIMITQRALNRTEYNMTEYLQQMTQQRKAGNA